MSCGSGSKVRDLRLGKLGSWGWGDRWELAGANRLAGSDYLDFKTLSKNPLSKPNLWTTIDGTACFWTYPKVDELQLQYAPTCLVMYSVFAECYKSCTVTRSSMSPSGTHISSKQTQNVWSTIEIFFTNLRSQELTIPKKWRFGKCIDIMPKTIWRFHKN